ncbi:TonB-dependent receptor [Flavisolibacter tropicus]|uniref:TonB-dependent receptor n=1 Tax=Flavisolibacter tropicus TaxID=1492898 RepID=A0A172U0Y5_9BACT|nr:carboxypeptidase regulatory-like domain-containing protein [Flavisolibacter tropicus]ANE52882.1 TonB-dependent receptor [Flavisolibacter tropicus]
MLKRLLLLLTLAFLTGPVLFAQVTTSSMGGTLKDGDGAVLSGATIVAVHTPSGTRYTTVTQASGQFTINNMRVGGPYQVTASYVGLQSQTYNDIYLQLGQTFLLDAALPKNSQTLENVVVTTSGRRNGIMNANRTGSVTNIGAQQINRLPSITRSLNDFTRLTPQANGNAIGGGNSRQNFITVDGSAFNNTFGIGSNLPANGSPISLDAIEEISVNVTPYDIRQSGFIGSSINSVTRSGTNQFNGSVYTYFRNQNQQGNKAGKTEFPVQRMDFKQYGARVGGPIIKNKLFFFLNFETEKTIQPGQQRFAATATSGAGSYGSNSNIARPLATELDAISDYLKTKYGYDPGPYQGYDFESDRTKILGRIDWNITDKHHLNFRYNQVEGKSPSFVSTSSSSAGPNFSTGFGRTDINALHFSNSNYFQENNFYSYQVELSSKFTNRLSNILRASYNNQDEPRSSNSTIFPFVDILKDGSPFTSFGYEPFSLGNLREVKTISAVDNVTLNLGKHNLLGGLEAEFSKTRNGFQPLGQSYYRFASWNDFVSGAKPINFAQTFSFEPGYEQAFPTFKFAQYSAYAQDEITMNPKFRLTLGLRAELNSYPDVAEVRTNPLVAAQTFAGGVKVNTGELPDPKVMLSPRVGFNYDVYGNRTLQVRGGTGIFTGRVPFVWIVGQSGNSGMLQLNQQYSGASVPGAFNPNIGAYRPDVVPKPGTLIPSQVTTFDKDFTLPQQWKTSLAVDSRLPGGIIGSLEMIYSKDINVLYSKNVNLVNPAPLNVAGYPDNRLIYPDANNQKFINNITSSGVPQAGATGAYNVIVTSNENKGYYASATIRLEKQFNRAFFASVAYTHTQAGNLYDGNGDQPYNTWSLINSVNGANIPTLDVASYTVPNRIIASFSYRKEYLKHLGTTVSLFYEGAHQGRFSYLYNSDLNRDGSNNDLLYIPRNASEITFVPLTIGSGASAKTYTAQEQSDLFFKYIEQDDYLKSRKGQYAERNGALLPWRNQFDVKILQDVFTNLGGKKNTIQLSLDIFNAANLLNSRWGQTQTTNAASLLTVTNTSSLTPGGTTKPTFRLAVDRNNPVTETFRDNANLSSTYYMQFGIRYIFN